MVGLNGQTDSYTDKIIHMVHSSHLHPKIELN